ncbi:MAG: hypothetical protein ACI9ES_002399 [Oceanospirillaceae bacterium]|jgi:hypothetical protein
MQRMFSIEAKIIRRVNLSDHEQHAIWNGIEDLTQLIVGDTTRHDLCFYCIMTVLKL